MNTHTRSNNAPGFASWEKWSLMTVVILGLAGVVVWFNLRVFGLADGAPYIAVVAFIVLVSMLVTRHIKRHPVTANFIKAAFIFEVMLTLCLGVNAAYSLSVMREMSIAGQSEARQAENVKTTSQTVEAIAKLKSPAAQRAAARALEAQQNAPSQVISRAEVFASKDQVLFWIMIAELAVAMLATFTLLGLSVFDKDLSGVPDFLERPEAKQARQSVPAYAQVSPSIGAGSQKPVQAWRGGVVVRPGANVRPQ